MCDRCGLHVGRTNAVPGEGSVDAQVVLVGEGPGFHEDQQGRPFVGQAGKLLDEMITAIGIRRGDVFIANLLKCRPPNNRDPEPEEARACFPYLDQQLALILGLLCYLDDMRGMRSFPRPELLGRVV